MKYLIIIPLFFLYSCSNNHESKIEQTTEVDSVLQISKRLSDTSIMLNKIADEKTDSIVHQVENRIHELVSENGKLSNQITKLKNSTGVTKTIVIRDTIVITEKKNFWGKTKRSTDSSKSISEDTTQNNN
jgi:hypothetical protein